MICAECGTMLCVVLTESKFTLHQSFGCDHNCIHTCIYLTSNCHCVVRKLKCTEESSIAVYQFNHSIRPYNYICILIFHSVDFDCGTMLLMHSYLLMLLEIEATTDFAGKADNLLLYFTPLIIHRWK